VLAACTGGGEVARRVPPALPTAVATEVAEQGVSPSPSAAVTSEPPDDAARLEELRASRAFIELAEHDRAPGGRWSAFTYTQFGIAGDGGLVGEWVNKRELWDSFVPAFRDECLLAGEPATEPMWDEQLMIPVGVNARWNDESTQGRGHSVDVYCAYVDPESGETVELFTAALIEHRSDGAGEVVAVMPSLPLPESQHPGSEEREQALRQHVWSWIEQQGVDL
jgi:hypothetical protein